MFGLSPLPVEDCIEHRTHGGTGQSLLGTAGKTSSAKLRQISASDLGKSPLELEAAAAFYRGQSRMVPSFLLCLGIRAWGVGVFLKTWEFGILGAGCTLMGPELNRV